MGAILVGQYEEAAGRCDGGRSVEDDSRLSDPLTARRRCGEAEPTVSAPTRTPIARPRPLTNHEAIIFIPVG